MGFESWHAFYTSDAQSLWALLVAPALFLIHLLLHPPSSAGAADPMRVRFLRVWAFVFCVETLLDPVATGPLLRALGAEPGALATVVMLGFVLLGDFRVLFLVFGLTATRGLARAAGVAALWTAVVPIGSWLADAALRAWAGELPSQALWLVYECGFVALALTLRARVLPARAAQTPEPLRRHLRLVMAYAAGYYALWALSDALILVAGLDAGWLLRALPNQLYYAFFVPFAYFSFFSRRLVGAGVSASSAGRA